VSERLDRIEKILEEMTEKQKNDRILLEKHDKSIERLDKSIERHDKILANLEANQIVIGKAVESIKEDVHGIKVEVSKLVNVVSGFMDTIGYKFRDHESRIKKLEDG